MAKVTLEFKTNTEADAFIQAFKDDGFIVIGPDYCDGGTWVGIEDDIISVTKEE